MRRTEAARRRAADRRRQITTFVGGVALVAVLVAAVVGIYDAFSGDFSNYVEVRADLPVGQPIELRSRVEFRQVQVGHVERVDRPLPGGAIEVTLQIRPNRIGAIPADVRARVAPTSLFGTETVVLDSPGPGVGRLRSGAVIPPAGGSASLQGALTNLNHLLTGLRPARIDTTLSALSGALSGQGQAAGAAIRSLNSYLQGLIPHLPALNSDIDLLAPVLNGLSASVPALLDGAANAATVARTFTRYQALIATVLTDGAHLSGTGTRLLSAVGASLHSFLVNLQPILADLGARPNLPADTLDALNALTTSFLPALSSGSVPAANVAATEGVDSPYEAYLAGANEPGLSARQDQQEAHAAFASSVDPPTYTAADCPHYGPEAGPNCPGSVPAASTAGARTAASHGAAGPQRGVTSAAAATLTPAQQGAVTKLFRALTGRRPAQAAADDLILAPLLQSLAP